MSGSRCSKCGLEMTAAGVLPGDSQVCETCAAKASSHQDEAEYQLAPPEFREAPRPPSPPPRRQAQEQPQPSFFCWPLLAALAVTLPGMMCLCPLAMFFEVPKGLLMLWGIVLLFWGIFWFGFRFKKLTGEHMPDEAPWYLTGGLSIMLQLTGYVIQEPVIFGPPFSLFVLGGLLILSPIFTPDLSRYFQRSPVAGAPAPAATAPATPSAGATTAAESAKQDPTAAPAAAKEPTLKELLAENPMAYLTDLAEFDVQPGACPVGKHGNLGDGNRIVVQGKESPHGLGMHPTNPPAVAKASYRIDGQRATLKGGVALNDTAESPWGAAVFAIHADGKLLWKSPPIKSRGTVTAFEVDLESVEVLQLSVVAEVHSHYVHAVWVEPRLIRK